MEWKTIDDDAKSGAKVILYNKDWEDLSIARWDWVESCDEYGEGGFCAWHVSELHSCEGDGILWPELQTEPTHWTEFKPPEEE